MSDLIEQLRDMPPDYLENQYFRLPDEKIDELRKLIAILDDDFENTKEKGDRLEDIAVLIFETFNAHEIAENIRTSTNEIDLFLKPFGKAREIYGKVFPPMCDDVMIECKNYNRNLGVTYVGKFISLLRSTKCQFGIIFTDKPFTGDKTWDDGYGLTKKAILKEDICILNFNREDLNKLLEGKNFIKIISDKFYELRNDIDLEKYITRHDNEEKL